MLRGDRPVVSYRITSAQEAVSRMKKLFVLIGLIAVVAACGGAAGGAGSSSLHSSEGNKQSVPGGPVAAPDPSRSTGDGSATTVVPGTTVPALQGPPVIRQAQMTVTVGNGLF